MSSINRQQKRQIHTTHNAMMKQRQRRKNQHHALDQLLLVAQTSSQDLSTNASTVEEQI